MTFIARQPLPAIIEGAAAVAVSCVKDKQP